MIANISQLSPQANEALQPLREIGTMEKTQFWDMEDVMVALREANFRGISLQRLRNEFRAPLEGLRQAC